MHGWFLFGFDLFCLICFVTLGVLVVVVIDFLLRFDGLDWLIDSVDAFVCFVLNG